MLVIEIVKFAVPPLVTVCEPGLMVRSNELEPPPPPPPPPPAGVIAFEGADAGPVPTPFVAVTVNV